MPLPLGLMKQAESGPLILPPVYTGPGDIVSGAIGWWGLRAYTASKAGSVAINIRRSGGSSPTSQDFNTLVTGTLDVASIQAFKTADGSTDLFVTTLYDQTGNGNDLVQASTLHQPSFSLSGLGQLPIMTFVAASDMWVGTGSAFNFSQPFSWTVIARRTANFTTAQVIMSHGAPNIQLQFTPSADTVQMYAGTAVTEIATDNTYHAFNLLFNGAASNFQVDATAHAGIDVGASGPASVLRIGAFGAGGFTIDGQIQEAGVWTSDISAQFNRLNSNQHTYWGF